MTEKAISPLRQRMIEDMTVRNLAADTQRNYIRAVKNLSIFLGRSPDKGHSRRSAALPAAHDREPGAPADHQQHGHGAAVLLQGNGRSPRCHQAPDVRRRTAQDSRRPQPARGGPLSGGGTWAEVQGGVRGCLWCRLARVGGGIAEGVRHRFQAHAAARRAGQGTQGSPCHALPAAARASARLVAYCTAADLAVPRLRSRAGDDDTPAQPRLSCRRSHGRPRIGVRGKDHQARDPAHVAAQLRDTSVRAERRYPDHPGAARSRQPRSGSGARLETTALYTHVAANIIRAVTSPLDRLTPLRPKTNEPPA